MTLGGLVLAPGSSLAYDLGTPNAIGGAQNDLIVVNGNLTLGGSTLDITDSGSFATTPGGYRLISYSGTLTGGASDIILGVTPGYAPGDVVVQTAVAGQVNLITTLSGLATQFWDGTAPAGDGAIAGGSGTWNNASPNWTNAAGTINQAWIPGFGILQATGGTVTLSEDVTARGLQFSANGYVVDGSGHTVNLQGLTPAQGALIRVDSGVTATIGASMAGAVGLEKADPGTLILTGANTYTGVTTITAGTLQVGNGGTTGSLGPGAVVDNGTLAFNRSDVVAVANPIGGAGALTQLGTGTTSLTGANTYTGATTIAAGTLQIGNGGTSGTLGTGAVTNNGTVRFNRSDAITVNNAIGGTGTIVQAGPGATTLGGVVSASAANATAGSLFVTGTLTAANVTATGATLGGTGTINGTATVGAGATLSAGVPGGSGVGALTVGRLVLNSGSTLALDLGGPSIVGGPSNDLVTVTGDLVLNATTLNVTDAGSFAAVPGAYRLITYGGTLTGSASNVTMGAVPGYAPAGVVVQTTIGGQVNLITTPNGLATQFWDGSGAANDSAIAGGSGTWNNSLGNWTSATGSFNQSWIPGLSIFATPGGTVTLGEDVSARALQFTGDGYAINGSGHAMTLLALLPSVDALVRVDGGVTATIAAPLGGTVGLQKSDPGTLVLAAPASYSGGTTIAAGTLQIGSGGATGSLVGNVLNHGTLAFNRSDALTFAGVVSGSGALAQRGAGTTSLTGANTYTGITTISAGTLQIGDGGTTGTLGPGAVINNGALVFNRSDAITIANAISGPGRIVQAGPGVTTLSGTAAAGATTVNAGALFVTGSLTSGNVSVNSGLLRVNGLLTGNVVVAPGAELGGMGTIAGHVAVNGGGTLAPGNSPGTLTVGSLDLAPGSMLNYELATPNVIGGGVNDLIEITGSLTLAGTLNVMGLPGFGLGTYRLMNYGGSFTDNTLQFGTLPAGFAYQMGTDVPGQVNLLVASATPDPVQYWDGNHLAGNGVVDGGSGVWSANPTNWTTATGSINQGFGGQTAVFGGARGTVMVVGPVDFSEIQFVTDGYAIMPGDGASLNAAAPATIVGLDRGVVALVGVPINGGGGLHLQGSGRLVLSASNGYTGGTTIGTGATLQVGNGDAAGSITGDVTNDGTLAFNRSGTITIGGRISGSGRLEQYGSGLVVLTGPNSYTGGTSIASGGLQIGDCGTSGSIAGDVRDESLLIFSRSDHQTFGGAISGRGAVIKNCGNTLVLTGANTYAGGTLINAGTLQGDTRSLQGDIIDNAALVFDQRTAGTFLGTLFGTGTLAKAGDGALLLNGHHGLTGLTTVQTGTLALDGTLPGAVMVAKGGTFDANGAIGGALNVDGRVSVRTPADGGFGLLGVVGGIALRQGSEVVIGVNASGASSALVSNGHATMAGSVLTVAPQPGEYGRVTNYAILHAAGGVSGTATAASTTAGLAPFLSQNSTTLFLTVLNKALPLQQQAVSENGLAVGGSLDRIKAASTGDLAHVVNQMTALDDASLGHALDQVSGEIHASANLLAAIDGDSVTDIVRTQISDRFGTRQELVGTVARSSSALWGTRTRRGWFRLVGEFAAFDAAGSRSGGQGRRAAHGAEATVQGLTAGFDWTLGKNWLAGLGGSYSHGRMTVEGIDERTSFDAPRAIGYVGYAHPRWAIDAGVSVAHVSYDITRKFSFTALGPAGGPLFGEGIAREATSSPSGPATDVWVEPRLLLRLGSWDVRPTLGLRPSWYHLRSFSESGAESLSLRGPSQTITSVQADAGARVSRAIGTVRPFGAGLYRRQLTDGRTAAMLQVGDQPAGRYEVDGLRLVRDEIVGQAGLLFLRANVGLSLIYEVHGSRDQLRQALQFVLRY